MKNRERIESLISILREKNRDSHFSENRAALSRRTFSFSEGNQQWLTVTAHLAEVDGGGVGVRLADQVVTELEQAVQRPLCLVVDVVLARLGAVLVLGAPLLSAHQFPVLADVHLVHGARLEATGTLHVTDHWRSKKLK